MSRSLTTIFIAFLVVTLVVVASSCYRYIVRPISPREPAAAVQAVTINVSAEDAKNAAKGASVEGPVVHENLTVFPIVGWASVEAPEIITLDEAEEQKKVRVKESEGGSVPVLEFQNKSDKPLLILAGEVVYGGKQDRVIQHDMIIDANEVARVDVRCVEARRWAGENADFGYSGKIADVKVRQKTQHSTQSDVWEEVGGKLKTLGTRSGTSAYQEALSSKEIEAQTKPYVDALMAKLREQKNVVGIVVAINGKIVFCDVFCSHTLFDKYAESLIESGAIQALAEKSKKAEAAPSKNDAQEFYVNAYKGKTKIMVYSNGSTVRLTTCEAQSSYSVWPKSDGSENDTPIHMSSFQNESK